MEALVNKKRRFITIFFHGKIIRIAMLSLICAAFTNTYASAAESYNQLLRNPALETAQIEKPFLNSTSLKNDNESLHKDNVKKKAIELEGVFLAVMMEPMFPEGKESNLYGGGIGSDIFRGLMIQEYGKSFADAGGIGLAQGIEKQMNRQAGN